MMQVLLILQNVLQWRSFFFLISGPRTALHIMV